MNNYVKFQTNIAEPITFKFDDPKEFDSKFKEGEKVYSYTVENRGVDAYVTATPHLHDMFQAIREKYGRLVGMQVQVLKYEDGNKKLWKILTPSNEDITPKAYSPSLDNQHVQGVHAPTVIEEDLKERINNMAIWAKNVERRLAGLETVIKELRGEEAVDFHQSFPAKDPSGVEEIPVIRQ